MSDIDGAGSMELGSNDREQVRRQGAAYHEAGHALAAHTYAWPITEVRLGTADTGWVGATAVEGPPPDRTEHEVRQEWAIFLTAPRAAVELGCPHFQFPAINDEDEELLARLALDVSPEREAQLAFWEQAQQASFVLVREHLSAITRLAAALLERERLTGTEVYALITAGQNGRAEV